MSTALWVVIAIVVIALIVLALLALMARRRSLRPLPEGARVRYSESWQRIEAQFVDQPQEAVRAADKLVVELVRERGGRDEHVPSSVERARHAIAGTGRDGDNDSMTEALRRAMLDYRSAVGELIGSDPRQTARRHPEVAS